MIRTFMLWLTRYYIWYCVKSDRKEKCPSCGVRQLHPMRYDTSSKKILHMCKTSYVPDSTIVGCGAVWATDCLRNPADWEVVEREQDEEGRMKVGQPNGKFDVSREPTIISSDKKKGAT